MQGEHTIREDNGETEKPETEENMRSDLTLETVILLVSGIFMTLFGLLGFWIRIGDLPYSQGGTYGLLLVIISLQIITLGKTPFGTHRQSWLLVIIGIGVLIPGTIACFIPGLIEEYVRLLVGIIMTAGGILLILQLIFVRERARLWIQRPGILWHLTGSCGLVYLMEILFGLISLIPGFMPGPATTLLCIIFGISLFYLAWTLMHIPRLYPKKDPLKIALLSPCTNIPAKKKPFLPPPGCIPLHTDINNPSTRYHIHPLLAPPCSGQSGYNPVLSRQPVRSAHGHNGYPGTCTRKNPSWYI